MRKIRFGIVMLCLLLCCSATAVSAGVSVSIGLPSLSIGINLPLFPELVPVPGYPVYYAPRVDANYFFYDGMYWVYQDDNWYASYWYDGPWSLTGPEVVPLFILRIPVRYYRSPPVYFRGWRADAPPRWGDHWGRGWEQQRRGWDKWKRGSAPPPRAPLPAYQRQYSGDRYPRQIEQQQMLRNQNYRYQPRTRAVREHFQQQGRPHAPAPAPRGRQDDPRMRGPGQPESQRPSPPHQGSPVAPRPQPPPQQREQRGPAHQEQMRPPGGAQREQQAPRPQGQEQRMQDRERSQEPRGHGQGQEQRRDEGRGR